MLLPTAYLASADWYRRYWAVAGGVQIEVMESFPKQTYRNRCTITTPDGPLTLTVPVKHNERKQLTRDVEISYQKHWQHQHWIALVSAYKRTPYFDYYMDYFRPFYEKETKFLLDLNEGLHKVIQTLLINQPPQENSETQAPLQHTTDWQAQDLETCFGNGISILDKLMEFGPETIMKIETGNR